MKRIIIIFSFISLFFVGCIEEFDPVITTGGNENIIVEARFSNENRYSYVKLVRSVSLEEDGLPPVIRGASVEVIDSANNCFEMVETSFGLYTIVNDEFVPVIGSYYQLHLVLPNGKEYISEPEKLLNPIAVNNVEKEFVRGQRIINGTLRSLSLINFFENDFTYTGQDDSLYFYHDHEGVYAYRSPFQGSTACLKDSTRSPAREINLVCYQTNWTDMPTNVSVKATNNLNSTYNFMQLRPEFEFLIGYSMILRRHRINKSFYDYAKNLKKQSEYGGSIFDAPPFKVTGNIYNVNNSDDRALGFFYTESISYSERFFIDNEEIPGTIYENRNAYECINNFNLPDINEFPEEQVIRPQASCCDCRLKMGSTDQKPSFWPQ